MAKVNVHNIQRQSHTSSVGINGLVRKKMVETTAKEGTLFRGYPDGMLSATTTRWRRTARWRQTARWRRSVMNQRLQLLPCVTMEELKPVIHMIDIKKSSALNVKSMVYKDAFLQLPNKLCKIFNASIQSEVFPNSWKCSTVVPLPKKPDVTEAVDLRPISLLSLPGKILEKIISKRLNRFLELNEILSEKQYGFRSGKSTLNAITALLDSIYNN